MTDQIAKFAAIKGRVDDLNNKKIIAQERLKSIEEQIEELDKRLKLEGFNSPEEARQWVNQQEKSLQSFMEEAEASLQQLEASARELQL